MLLGGDRVEVLARALARSSDELEVDRHASLSSDQRQALRSVAKPRALRSQQLGQVLADVAVAAEHLHRAVGDLERDALRLVAWRAAPRASRPRRGRAARRPPRPAAARASISIAMSASLNAIACLRARSARRTPGAPSRSRARLEGRARDADRERRERDAAACDQRARGRRRASPPSRAVGRHAHALERELAVGSAVHAHVALGLGREARRRRAAPGTPARVPPSVGDRRAPTSPPRATARGTSRRRARSRRRRGCAVVRGRNGVGVEARLEPARARPGAKRVAGVARSRSACCASVPKSASGNADERGREDRERDREVAPRRAPRRPARPCTALRSPPPPNASGSAFATRPSSCAGAMDARRPAACRLVGLARARPDLVRGELAHRLDDELPALGRLEVDHRRRSDALDDRRDAHAAADAQRDEGGASCRGARARRARCRAASRRSRRAGGRARSRRR